MQLDNLKDMQFGNLKVLSRAPMHKTPSGQSVTKWVCVCICGKCIEVTAQNLKNGHTRSCGCAYKQNNLKHGECIGGNVSRLYNIWAGVKARCYSKKNPKYKYYGGRGISICDEWHDFEAFKAWAIDSGYNNNLTIDRINNDGNYEPKNCRWVNQKIQSNNCRRNVTIRFNNKEHTISEWADISGIPYKTLWNRMHSGWDVYKALTVPVRGCK